MSAAIGRILKKDFDTILVSPIVDNCESRQTLVAS